MIGVLLQGLVSTLTEGRVRNSRTAISVRMLLFLVSVYGLTYRTKNKRLITHARRTLAGVIKSMLITLTRKALLWANFSSSRLLLFGQCFFVQSLKF